MAAVNVSLPVDHPTRIDEEKSKEIVSCFATNRFSNYFPGGVLLKSDRRLWLSFGEFSGEFSRESAIDPIHRFTQLFTFLSTHRSTHRSTHLFPSTDPYLSIPIHLSTPIQLSLFT